jgi:hypothetical protein
MVNARGPSTTLADARYSLSFRVSEQVSLQGKGKGNTQRNMEHKFRFDPCLKSKAEHLSSFHLWITSTTFSLCPEQTHHFHQQMITHVMKNKTLFEGHLWSNSYLLSSWESITLTSEFWVTESSSILGSTFKFTSCYNNQDVYGSKTNIKIELWSNSICYHVGRTQARPVRCHYG